MRTLSSVSPVRLLAAGSVAALVLAVLAPVGAASAQTLLYLSKTTDSLSINQYDQVTASPIAGQQVEVTANSNPGVASATTTGTIDQVQIQGLLAGTTNVTICTTDQSQCGTVTVTVAGGSSSTLSFTNSNPTVAQGQTTSIGTTNAQSSTLTLSSNSNSSAVSASVAGQNVTITGVTYGSSTITVCASGTSQCGTLYVTVGSGSGSSGSLTLSNSSPSVSVGQSTSISVSGGSGSYYVSNNTNSGIATVSLSGSTINIYGSAPGTSNATVCDSQGTAGCTTLYVTVGSASSGVTFSTTSPSISVGQSTSVTVYGSGSYYVSANTNSGVASTSLSGSNLTLYGSASGTSSITICEESNSSACGTLYVTVGSTSSSSSVTFSNQNPNVPLATSLVVALYGPSGYQFYVSSNSNPSIVSTSISGTTLTLYGLTSGSTTISVCVSGVSECGTLPVTVNGSTSTSGISFSTSNPSATQGQTVSDAIYGGSSYYISTNTSPTIVSSTVSGSNLNLYGIASGTSSVTVCNLQSISQCGTVTVTVNSSATSGGAVSFLTTSLPAATVGISYNDSVAVTGGSPPYTYSVYSGILPAGLSLGSTGQVTGVPTVATSSSFTLRASDQLGNSAIENLTLAVLAPASITVPPTSPAATGTAIDGYHDGTLVNDGGTIYIINNGTKTPFTSADAFTGLGYSFDTVVSGSTSNIPLSGTVVSSSSAAHPAGSWIDSSGTVYFVASSGIVPVPSEAVFTANSGQWPLVVPANSADLAQTVLSVMVSGDSRVE